MSVCGLQEEVLGGNIILETRNSSPPEPASHPKFQTPYRLHLPVVRAVEIRFRGADMGMASTASAPFVLSLSKDERRSAQALRQAQGERIHSKFG